MDGFHPQIECWYKCSECYPMLPGDEGTLALGISSYHTQTLAHEVIMDFIHFLFSADVQPRLLSGSLDRIIQWIVQPGLIVCVEISVP